MDSERRDADHWEAVEEGIELLQEGDHQAALRELSGVAEKDPDNPYAHQFLGTTYFEQQDYARALKCYVRALEVQPRYIGALIGAGQSLRLLGDHDRALRMGMQVLRVDRNDADGLLLVGSVHFQRGDYAQARGFLERFLHTNPEIEVALEVEGMLQVVRGEVDPPPTEA
ncbi:MAG: tetratricopeptide repeat protein [Myxococcota bacterium]